MAARFPFNNPRKLMNFGEIGLEFFHVAGPWFKQSWSYRGRAKHPLESNTSIRR